VSQEYSASNEWKRCRRRCSFPNLGPALALHLPVRTEEDHENSSISRCSGRDSNQTSYKMQIRSLTTWTRSLGGTYCRDWDFSWKEILPRVVWLLTIQWNEMHPSLDVKSISHCV
jgi:hypothetical protein